MKVLFFFCLVPTTMALRIAFGEDTNSEDTNSTNGKPVFYAVVMGDLADKSQVAVWLSSLRLLGKFTGEAVMVTDKPQCLQSTLTTAKLLGSQLFSDDAVDIYAPNPEKYKDMGNIHIIKRPAAKSQKRSRAMLEKTNAFVNLAVARVPHKVSSIIYADEDIVMAEDLTNFLSTVQGLEGQEHTLALFKDQGQSKLDNLHTGVFAIFPGESTETCLKQWGNNVLKLEQGKIPMVYGSAGGDQQALGLTKECKTGKGIKILPKTFFTLPTEETMTKGEKYEFVHFTNTFRMRHLSHENIVKYLRKLGIPDEIDPFGQNQQSCTAA